LVLAGISNHFFRELDATDIRLSGARLFSHENHTATNIMHPSSTTVTETNPGNHCPLNGTGRF